MSQTDFQTRTIGSDTYKIRMLDPLTANDMLVDIGKILAPALGAIGGIALGDKDGVEKLVEGSDNDDAVGGSFERAVVGLVDRIEKPKLRELIGQLSEVTEVIKGTNEAPMLSSIFSAHFRGRIAAMYKWLAFALEVQFKDFFDSLGPAIGRAAQLTGLGRSSSQNT